MTIGPEPTIRIFLISVLFGIFNVYRAGDARNAIRIISNEIPVSETVWLDLRSHASNGAEGAQRLLIRQRRYRILIRRAQGGIKRAQSAGQQAEHERIEKPRGFEFDADRSQARY